MLPRTAFAVVGSALLVSSCGGGSPSPSAPTTASSVAASPAPPASRPNLVLIVTDDLDVPTYGELTRFRDQLDRQGLSFTRAYATQPLCAPSRASILTGQYSHNHGILHNRGPSYGFPGFLRHEAATVATWLKARGYRTALVGKYINDYATGGPPEHIPPGWDHWFGHLSSGEDGRYFGYSVNDNGNVVSYRDQPDDYSVDVETRRAVALIEASAGQPEPLFLYLAPQSPHSPAHYAARFGAEFRYALAPRVPSFNESRVTDKPAPMRGIEYMTDAQIEAADVYQRRRLRSLMAVEEELEIVLVALAKSGRLADTYVFFVSDNGLLMGQHRAVDTKGFAYEECIQIPFVVRGPGIRPGSAVDRPVLNIDIAPTLLELAGAAIPDSVDGRSLVPFLRGTSPSGWRTDVLIENHPPGPPAGPSYALRTADWMYNHQDTEELELYDMKADPYQLESLHRTTAAAVLAEYERRIQVLVSCKGTSCRNQ